MTENQWSQGPAGVPARRRCHLNPAVSIGLWAGGRFEANQLLPYIIAQVIGGIAVGGVLYVIASGAAGNVFVGHYGSH